MGANAQGGGTKIGELPSAEDRATEGDSPSPAANEVRGGTDRTPDAGVEDETAKPAGGEDHTTEDEPETEEARWRRIRIQHFVRTGERMSKEEARRRAEIDSTGSAAAVIEKKRKLLEIEAEKAARTLERRRETMRERAPDLSYRAEGAIAALRREMGRANRVAQQYAAIAEHAAELSKAAHDGKEEEVASAKRKIEGIRRGWSGGEDAPRMDPLLREAVRAINEEKDNSKIEKGAAEMAAYANISERVLGGELARVAPRNNPAVTLVATGYYTDTYVKRKTPVPVYEVADDLEELIAETPGEGEGNEQQRREQAERLRAWLKTRPASPQPQAPAVSAPAKPPSGTETTPTETDAPTHRKPRANPPQVAPAGTRKEVAPPRDAKKRAKGTQDTPRARKKPPQAGGRGTRDEVMARIVEEAQGRARRGAGPTGGPSNNLEGDS
jgi:hypothetical protein